MIDACQKNFNRSTLGSTAEILFERQGRRAGQIVGRSPCLLPVQVEAPESLIGSIGSVVIESLGSNSLFGRLAGRETAAPDRLPAEALA